jgi:hypothetical protein
MTEIKLVRRNWRCEKHRKPGCEEKSIGQVPGFEFPCVICGETPTELVARETEPPDLAATDVLGQPVEVRESGRAPTNLRAIDTSRSEYSAVIIQHLEVLLERAKRGELLCLTCVIDDGQNWQATSAGRLQKSDALYAFELWKRDICFPVSES